MLKLYCQKCGSLNAYVSERPNFCQKCGNSFSGEQPASDAIESSASIEKGGEIEPQENTQFNIYLSALDVEVESGRTSTDSLGNIMGTAKSGQMETFNGPEGAQSYTMDDFAKEAGNRKSQNEPEET